jgi:hypothetical protein
VVALVALAAAAGAWFWARQAPHTGIGPPHGVMVLGAGAFLTAMIAAIRDMSLSEVLHATWDLIVRVLSTLADIVMGIWDFIAGLLDWD